MINPNPIYWKNLSDTNITSQDLKKVIGPILDTLNNYKRNIRNQAPALKVTKRDISVAKLDLSWDSAEDVELGQDEEKKLFLEAKKIFFEKSAHGHGKQKYQVEEQPDKRNQVLISPPLNVELVEKIKIEKCDIFINVRPIKGSYIEFDFSNEEEKIAVKNALQNYGRFRILHNKIKTQDKSKEIPYFLHVNQYYPDEDAALIDEIKIDDSFEIRIEPNISVIEKKIRAILAFIERPKNYILPLIQLFEKQARSLDLDREWGDIALGRDDYKYLSGDEYPGVDEQRRFVNMALNTPDFAILEGPPGSGKTTTILEILHQATKRNLRVLLVASTHIAVDNVIERIDEEREKGEELHIFPVRIGDADHVHGVAEDYIWGNLSEKESKRIIKQLKRRNKNSLSKSQKKLLHALENKSIQFNNFILDIANVVCGTTIGILRYPSFDLHDFKINEPFDMLIIDEASKTTFQEFLVPSLMAKKWIIIGDKMQLSPFIEEGEVKALKDRCLVTSNFEEEHQWLCSEIFAASQSCAVITDILHLKENLVNHLDHSTENPNGLPAILCPYRTFHDAETGRTSLDFDKGLYDSQIITNFGSTGILIDYRCFSDMHPGDILASIPADFRLIISHRLVERIDEARLRQLYNVCSLHDRRLAYYQKNINEKHRPASVVKEWIDEISWRLKRMYELRHQETLAEKNTSLQRISTEVESLLPKWDLSGIRNVQIASDKEIYQVTDALKIKSFNLLQSIDHEKEWLVKEFIKKNMVPYSNPVVFFKQLKQIEGQMNDELVNYFYIQIIWKVIKQRGEREKWIEAFLQYFPELLNGLLTFYVGNQVYDTLRIEYPSIIELLQEGLMIEPKYRNSVIYNCTIYKGYETKREFWEKREVKLKYQHRMHPDISKFIREHFYDGKQVKDPDGTAGKYDIQKKRIFPFRPGSRNVWINVKGQEKGRRSYTNEKEVEAIYQFYCEFEDWAAKNAKPKERPKDDGIWKVAIITFYLGQRGKLSTKFKKHFHPKLGKFNFKDEKKHISLKICSVDSFQGQEADVILLSFVRTNRIGFLDSRNRLNVALSRAKYYQACFGNKRFFSRNYVKKDSPILFELANELPTESPLGGKN
ncbi:MAG: AAA domain-containing protein [Promethearchaeota archaeon]